MTAITWIDEAQTIGFGGIEACVHAQSEIRNGQDWAVVHGCKFPCHRRHVGYAKTIAPNHPNYLSAKGGGDTQLYLNLIDPPVPLFKLEGFKIFFEFIDQNLGKRPIVIHCNRGESRAPSLALLVMAKRLEMLPNDSYKTARTEFEKRHAYKPGDGIAVFLERHWDDIR